VVQSANMHARTLARAKMLPELVLRQ
jgi:hypothetical protein